MFLARFIDQIATQRRRRAVTLELDFMSERQLSDLGLSRLDLLQAQRRRS